MVRKNWFEQIIRKMNNNSLRNSDQMIYFERMTFQSIKNNDKDIILKK